MAKIWKDWPDQCDQCGSDSVIFTDEDLPEGVAYDGDEIQCTEYGATGQWSVYVVDEAYTV